MPISTQSSNRMDGREPLIVEKPPFLKYLADDFLYIQSHVFHIYNSKCVHFLTNNVDGLF